MDGGNENASVCVGLDVGYGNLKVVASRCGSDEAATFVLPIGAGPKAYASKSLSGRVDVGDGALVLIDGEEWVAGVGPLELQHFARPTHADYPKTREYLALYYAALSKLGHSHIGTLVTGLPVRQFYEGKQTGLVNEIVKRLRGRHYIAPAPGGIKEVVVDRVLVVPQPAGAYADMVHIDPSVATDVDRLTLVLDIGYYSADWVLVQNRKIKDGSSGSSTDATSRILEDAARRISAAHGGIKVSAARIESAYRAGRETMSLGDHTVDHRSFIAAAASEISERVMAQIGTSIRDLADLIDVVEITGGGGGLFERAVRNSFPASKTVIGTDPVIANARGFMRMAKSHEAALAAASAALAANVA